MRRLWSLAACVALMGAGYTTSRVEIEFIQTEDSLGVILDWQPGVPDGAYRLPIDHYRVRVEEVGDQTLETSQVLHPLTIDTLWIGLPAPGEHITVYGAVQTVDTAGIDSGTWTQSRTARWDTPAPQPLPPLPPTSVDINLVAPDTVVPPDTVIPPPDTVVPPPSGGAVFSSDWGTATGSSNAALLDGGAWNELLNNGDALEVISSAGLDFPSENVLRVTPTRRSSGNGAYSANIRLLATSNVIPVPSVGESVFYRWYMSMNVPNSYTADNLTHPVQDGRQVANGVDNWNFEARTSSNGTWTPGFFTGSGGTGWPEWRHNGPTLQKNTTYRFELQVYRNASNTFQIHVRVYSSSDVLIADDDDFHNANSTDSLTSNPSFLFSDPTILRGWQVGLNGFSSGSSFGWVYSYQGATAVCIDDWCGPYGTTPTPPPAATTYWSEDMESGSYVTSNFDPGGPWNSGDAQVEYDSDIVHDGNRSMKLTINTENGSTAVRLPVRTVTINGQEEILPDEAYYSVWYYIPSGIETVSWWNVMDWKTAYAYPGGGASSDPTYSFNVGEDSPETYTAWLYDHVGDDGRYNTQPGRGIIANSNVTWPGNTWMHLECYYRWSITPDGHIACWINEQLAWNVPNIVTQFDQSLTDNLEHPTLPRQWKIDHYSDGLVPSSVSIYIDDAAIAGERS